MLRMEPWNPETKQFRRGQKTFPHYTKWVFGFSKDGPLRIVLLKTVLLKTVLLKTVLLRTVLLKTVLLKMVPTEDVRTLKIVTIIINHVHRGRSGSTVCRWPSMG
jgi:hypothetical protein